MLIISQNNILFNEISLMRYDIISVPSYAEGIYHRTTVRYHIEDISPVPQGTDIIVKKRKSIVLALFTKLEMVSIY